ncbi:reverse transcriptase domain-containing protein [Tanacetum coccineum]
MNSRFNESVTKLLRHSVALDLRISFNNDDICKVVMKYYPLDFTDQDKIQLKAELQNYELDVRNHPRIRKWGKEGATGKVVLPSFVLLRECLYSLESQEARAKDEGHMRTYKKLLSGKGTGKEVQGKLQERRIAIYPNLIIGNPVPILPDGLMNSSFQKESACLPPKKFLTHYLQQKRYTKDPVELHQVKQRERESTKAFIERFTSESLLFKGAPKLMRIFGFMHGITHPGLIKRLNDNIPKTVDEMMSVTKATSSVERKVLLGNPKGKGNLGSNKTQIIPAKSLTLSGEMILSGV